MKGFIFAAGYGTRNLPATKSLPKELFPIYNITAMDFILEECAEAGITELIILTSRRKKALEDYFDREFELETILEKSGKTSELALIRRPLNFNVSFVRQQEMKGTGHALLTAKSMLKDEPFAAFFPDDILLDPKAGIRNLKETFEKTGCSVLGSREEFKNISAYGVIEYKEMNGLNYVTNIVEKPKAGTIDSNLVSIGRFIYTPEFLHSLEKDYANHASGEFYPMGAMMDMAKQDKLITQKINGKILDTGNHDAYLNAILEYAYSTEGGRKVLEQFLNNRG